MPSCVMSIVCGILLLNTLLIPFNIVIQEQHETCMMDKILKQNQIEDLDFTEINKNCSKKIVIEKIMNENNLKGVNLAVFGDGPVEMRECRRRNGIAIGVASDEIRRYGLNPSKRTRLIKAGAQIIIPDFSIKSVS